MSTESPDDEAKTDLKALGRHFEARRLELGMKPGELAMVAGLARERSRFIPIEGGRIREFELRGRDLGLGTIDRLAAALRIEDAIVLAIGGIDLAGWREALKQTTSEYERRRSQFILDEFEKDGRPPPNVMVGRWGWHARKKAEFEALHGKDPARGEESRGSDFHSGRWDRFRGSRRRCSRR